MSEPSWPVWQQPAQPCPQCGQPIAPSASFCEACGATLEPSVELPPEPSTPSHQSQQTRRLGARHSDVLVCPACGGTIDTDGYCQVCGTKAPSARDHYSDAPADWVGGVCDRGIKHARNEDAMALWAEGRRAVLVVCDGVSTSIDSDEAATTAAQTIRQVLIESVRRLSTDAADEALIAEAMVTAAAAANAAVSAQTAQESPSAASATVAAAVVVDDQVHYANLGDSRVYFLTAANAQLLSLDDSLAQAFVAEGMPRAEAEALPRAHAITKWLGRDAADIVPRTGVHHVTEPGWLLVCSDGLWNYASEPVMLREQLVAASSAGDDVLGVAQRLVDWANGQGGRDNVTVALARCPAPEQPTRLEPTTSTSLTVVEEHLQHG